MTDNKTPLKWETEKRKVKDLVSSEINPRKITQKKKEALMKSLEDFNLVDIPVIDKDGILLSGNKRIEAMLTIGRGEETIDVRVPNRKLTEQEHKKYMLIANTHAGEFDVELLDAHFEDVIIEFDTPIYVDEETTKVRSHERKLNPGELGTEFSLPSGDKDPFQSMSFVLADQQVEEVRDLVSFMKKSEYFKGKECFGNENQNGNAIYLICKEWAELKKLS